MNDSFSGLDFFASVLRTISKGSKGLVRQASPSVLVIFLGKSLPTTFSWSFRSLVAMADASSHSPMGAGGSNSRGGMGRNLASGRVGNAEKRAGLV